MKQVYFLFSKALLLLTAVMLLGKANAQRPTTVTFGNCGEVTQNFNTNNGGFSSPSLHGDRTDLQFFFASSLGLWNMVDDGAVPAPQNAYNVSIISPVYLNPNPIGFIDVGFYYEVPNANIDQFMVRIFDVRVVGTVTQFDLIASSGVQSFPNPPTGPTPNSGPVCLRLIDTDITNTTPYRVEVTYFIKNGGNSTFDNFSLGAISAIPLPVTFTGIVAERENNGVNVKWDVADERDVQEYVVERSTNGTSFTAAGTVAVKGKSVYQFFDPNTVSEILFYRIKSVDIDGRFKYSSIIRLNKNGNSYSNILRAYPTPARSQVTLQHGPVNTTATITISTLDNRVIKVLTATAGSSHTPIDISALSSGMYVIRFESDGKTQTTKLVKQ